MDDKLFAAALVTVANSGFYNFTTESMQLVVSTECVLACWGHSNVVRRMGDRDLKDVVNAALQWATGNNNFMGQLIAKQPFMTVGWRPDENENTPLGMAVESLLHRWENRPWTSAKSFVGIAERHCIETGAYTQKTAFFCPAMQETCSILDIAELGATVADVVSPGSDSTSRRPLYKWPLPGK